MAAMPSIRRDVRLDTSLELLLEHMSGGRLPRVLATVVGTAGSTYRKPGARMLIMGDGGFVGLLSGGCLEADLKLHAQNVLESGVPRAVEYDMRGPDDVLFGVGAGCEGAMRVLLEPVGSGSPATAALAAAAHAIRSGQPTTLVSVHDSGDGPPGPDASGRDAPRANLLGTYEAAPPLSPLLIEAAARSLAASESRTVDLDAQGRRGRAFVQFLAPPPHLLICGAGPDAQPVVRAARGLGWRVSLVDHRPAYVTAAQSWGAETSHCDPKSLPSTIILDRCHAAVVMSHHLPSDMAYLREFAAAGVPPYVGLLGPQARRARLAEELGPIAAKLSGRLRGPVGLDIGAVTPEGIALAIVGQIHAWLAGRGGGIAIPLAASLSLGYSF